MAGSDPAQAALSKLILISMAWPLPRPTGLPGGWPVGGDCFVGVGRTLHPPRPPSTPLDRTKLEASKYLHSNHRGHADSPSLYEQTVI